MFVLMHLCTDIYSQYLSTEKAHIFATKRNHFREVANSGTGTGKLNLGQLVKPDVKKY